MRLLKLLLAFALFMSFTVVAFAHPGKTDSNGGHYNHDTGEYHYHHGYGEHQHYDMDGDGFSDCPYDFKDNTKPSNGTADSSNSYTTPPTTLPPGLQALMDEHQSKKKTETTTKVTEAPPEEETDNQDTKMEKNIFHHIWDLLCSLWAILGKFVDLLLGLLCFAVICVIIEKIWNWIKCD